MPNNDMNMPEMHCSFCGKSRSQVRKLIQGPNGVFICDECVKECADIISDDDAAEAEEPGDESALIENLPTPHEIYEELSQYVMGQEAAKRAMSVAVYNHYRRVQMGDEEVNTEGEKVSL